MTGVGGDPQEALGQQDRGEGVSQSTTLEASRARGDGALGERGERLRADLVTRDPDLDRTGNPMAEVMLSACRTADRVERLELEAEAVPSWVTTDKGALVTHPVLVEVRQQATLLARLVAALRLPDTAGKRPQARPLRGVHGPGKVSSIERARLRAEGQEGA